MRYKKIKYLADTYICMTELISIRVRNRQQNPVKPFQKIRFSHIFYQLFDRPSDSGWRDPLSSVGSCFDEDDRFACILKVSGGNLEIIDRTTFEGACRGDQLGYVRVTTCNVSKIIVVLKKITNTEL